MRCSVPGFLGLVQCRYTHLALLILVYFTDNFILRLRSFNNNNNQAFYSQASWGRLIKVIIHSISRKETNMLA
jgi:hypothetical protein